MNGNNYNDFFSAAEQSGLRFDSVDSEYLSSSFKTETLIDALEKYSRYTRGKSINSPSRYFIKILETLETESPREAARPPKKAPHYPFTDEDGVTWHSFDYAEKGGQWYKKNIVENQFGCDAIMRPCEKPAIETRQEAENRVAEDKQLGLYNIAAQKFFDCAKSIAVKFGSKTETPPALEPIPWEKT